MTARKAASIYAIILAALLAPAAGAQTRYAAPPPLLDHVVKTLEGEDRHLAAYYGSPILVVNVASRCGLTRQYAGLQSIYEKYGPQGLSILAFPCNDFRGQEPGTPEEIAAFCETRFGITFELMEKIHVAQEHRHPFYDQLIRESGNPEGIRWNFEKFLIHADGTLASRFEPKTSPGSPALISAIEDALSLPRPAPLGYTHYLGRRVAHTMHWKAADWLTRTEREREEATSIMLRELRLQPGMVVADIGCGNGYHALPMAMSVAPGGKVIGSDIQPEMLSMLKERASAKNITNIVTVVGTLTSPALADSSIDLALLVDAYHEFSHPPQMLASIRRALRPDGQVVLVEFRAEDKDVPIREDHKMTRDQVVKELETNGFRLARSFDALPWQHMLFFEQSD